MKKSILLLVGFILMNVVVSAQHTSRVKFTNGWKFRLDSTDSYSDPAVNDASWRTLNLPHDWSIEGRFDKGHPAGTGGGALPGGLGWYRKKFTVPLSQKGKKVFIHFDGVYCNSEVFINGRSLGVRPNGYISFQYDMTPYLKYGHEKNVIAVKVDNSQQPNSRWYSGSGIYRNVWLTVIDPLHIQQWGTYITTPDVSEALASVEIETKVNNEKEVPQDFVVVNTLYDAGGKLVTKVKSNVRQLPKSAAGYQQKLSIPHPVLWSVDKPYLYHMISAVTVNGKVIDSYETTFGVRTFGFDRDKGFFLNGKPLKIMGVCNHHDLGALGAAINLRALERQLQILKAMGCNGIRTAHNPPAPELLDLCDKMGFIVMNESFDLWAKSKTKYDYHAVWEKWHERDLSDFIVRDRNHPSVFVWSIGNEIMEQWGDEKKGDTSGREIARELKDIVRAMDTTRSIITANNEVNHWNQLLQSNAFELIGYNYNHKRWGNFLKEWPGKKLIVTESTSALATRGHYDRVPADMIRRWPEAWDKPLKDGNADLTISAYDHVSTPWGTTHEESIKELKKWDHVSGMYVWTGFDYLGEPTPYSWPARSSYFGIIDLAGFPKDVYYLYQSEFTNLPVLHILPHWNWMRGDTIDVVAYYNQADEIELYVNGGSVGAKTKKDDELHVKWRVPYMPGELKAISRKNGKTVLTKGVRTAGEAYQVLLKADRSTINADGEDLSFVTVEIVDKEGVLVPYANHLVKFAAQGQGFIAGVDNGNPVSLEPFKAYQHTAMNGKALCIVQSNGKKGSIRLTATVEGMPSTTIIINTQ